MARQKKNDFPPYMCADRSRVSSFVVRNPINGKSKRFRDETKARAVAVALGKWVRTEGKKLRPRRKARKSGNWNELTKSRRQIGRRRRRAMRRATPVWANLSTIRMIYRKARELTAESGIRFSVDHMYPLQGALVCGLHCENNLAIVPHWANVTKSNS